MSLPSWRGDFWRCYIHIFHNVQCLFRPIRQGYNAMIGARVSIMASAWVLEGFSVVLVGQNGVFRSTDRMKLRPSALICCIFLVLAFFSPSLRAAGVIDSLKALIAAGEHDTLRAKHLNNIGTAFFNSNLDSAFAYWNHALELGDTLSQSDDPAVARAGKFQVMRSSSNTAIVYQYRGLYPLALRQYQRCLRLTEELADKRGKMIALNNIGLIKMGQEKHEEALDHFTRSQEIAMEMQDSMVASTTLNNIGTALKRLKRFPEAMQKFRESLVWSEAVGNDDQIVDDLINIGSIQLIDSLPDSALGTFWRSYGLAVEIEYALGMPAILGGISESYEGLGRLDSALLYAQMALDTARAMDLTEEIVGALEQMSEVNQRLGRFDVANRILVEYIHLKDSLFNTDKAIEFGQLEQSFDYERKEYEEALQTERAAMQLKERNFQQYLISFAVVCLVAMLLMLGVRVARNRRLRYFVVFGALLVFFEFALVLTDSFVDGFTGGLPIPKLLANILLASMIAPFNILLEKRLMRNRKVKVDGGGQEIR
jgi:tetratricopeptide (TPR) repeat protein